MLLDDVLSELDSERQNHLLNSIDDIQTIITCTGLDEFIENRFKINKVFQVTEGKVESIQPYGAFIDLGNGLTGLVHISQICEKRIKTPAAVLHVGDEVKGKVIAVKDGKLSLSMKALQDVAAEEIQEETVELPESEELTTNLGALFANIKLS